MSVVLFGVLVVQVVGVAALFLLLVLSRKRQGPRRPAHRATGWVVQAMWGRPVPVPTAPVASRAPPGGWDDVGIGVALRRPGVAIDPVYTSLYRRRRRTSADDSQ